MPTQLAVLFTLFALTCYAQLTTPGQYTPQAVTSRTSTHVLPPMDNAKLLAEEVESKHTHGGYQFAHVLEFPIGFESWGTPASLESGARVWTTTIISKGATSLGVIFKNFSIPEGGELYLVGQKEIRGAITAMNRPSLPSGHLTTFPMEGEVLTLEYYQPADVETMPSIDIMMVAHGYKAVFCFGCSGSCNINAVCDQLWEDEARSVGMLLTASGGRFCSGALVNNVNSNGDQLFLTAAHCASDNTDQVMFRYQSPQCNTNQNGPTNNIIGGLQVVARDTRSDFELVRINEAIPAAWNVFLSGISGENLPPTDMIGIHHPRGDVKKICYSNMRGEPDRWSGSEPGNWHWRIPFWNDGTTEPGSSGSPLYDQNQRVVGQLHGGVASCSVIDWDMYGATWASWPLGLKTFLDPSNTGRLLIDGVDLNAVRKTTA